MARRVPTVEKFPMNHRKQLSSFLFAIVFLGLSILASQGARAEGVNVFAWLKGDSVILECNFGDKQPAADATIEIRDAVDKKLLRQGKTNASGLFSFKVPAVVQLGHGLSIDVNAGEGRVNSWHMDPSELYEAASLTAGFESAAIADGGQDAPQPPVPRNYPPVQNPAPTQILPSDTNLAMPQRNPGAADHRDYIRNVVREELENSIAPVRTRLEAQSVSHGSSGVQIIGYIGWIVGIIGIILYFKSRRDRT